MSSIKRGLHRGVKSCEEIEREANRDTIKEIYNKIKEIKEEIEFTKHNGYDFIKNQKYINSLECDLKQQYEMLEFIEKQEEILNNDKTSVDDYLDKASILNKSDEYTY